VTTARESKEVMRDFLREAILEAVLLLEDPVLLDERVDPVNHLLDELDLAVAEAMLVRDVVGDPGLTARLAACTWRKKTWRNYEKEVRANVVINSQHREIKTETAPSRRQFPFK
jgi:hypothetical protein